MKVRVRRVMGKELKDLSLKDAKIALRVAIAYGDISAIDDIMKYHKNSLHITAPNNFVKMLQTGNCCFSALTYMVNEYDLYLFNSTIDDMGKYYTLDQNESFDACINKIRGKLYTEDLSIMYLRGEYELLERAIVTGADLSTLNRQQIKSLMNIAEKRQMYSLYEVMGWLYYGIKGFLSL